MSYIRPTLSQLATQIENDLYTRFGGTSRPVRFSVNKILSRVISGAVHLVYGYIDFAMKQIIVDSATSEYLDRWALVWGLQRKSAFKSNGVVQFTGNDGAKIPAFSQIQTNDNFIFQTRYEVMVQAGIANVEIEALVPTGAGNIKGGTPLNLVSPISNIQSTCIVDPKGTLNGSDIETDDALRGRVLDRIRNAPCAGNKKDYETWCLQIPGVTRAWCYPQFPVEGNVGLSFVRDNDENIIPTEEQLEDVKNIIKDLMPCTATLNVFAPTPNLVNFKIKSTDISDETKKQITDQLKYLFFNIAFPSGTIYISDIQESLASIKSTTPTPIRIILVSPTLDILLDDKSVGVVGNITFEDI